MITDKLTTFAKGVAVPTGGTSTVLFGDVVDMSVLSDIGQGAPIYLVAQVTDTVVGGGATTVKVSFVSDAQEAVAIDGTATVHHESGAVAVAELNRGATLIKMALPMEGAKYERYLGILVEVAGAAATAGALDVFLTPNASAWKAYPDNKK